MRRAAIAMFVVALAVVGCKKEPTAGDVSIDMARAGAEIEQRMSHLWDKPLVAKATDQFFDALGDAPALRDRATALLAALQADPAVAQPIEKLMTELTSDAGLQQVVVELMAEHPGASADDIGALVGDRFAKAWASPQVSAAWQAAWDGLIRRLSGNPDLAVLEHTVFKRFEARYSDAAMMAKWSKRLAELGKGTTLSRAQATDLFLDKFFAADRIEAIVADVLGNATFRSESAAALGKLLSLDSVSKDLRTGAAEMLADPAVHDAAVVLMKQLTAKQPDGAIVGRQLQALLAAPSVTNTIRRMLHTASTDPAVGAVGTGWLDRIGDDKQLQGDFDKFCYGW